MTAPLRVALVGAGMMGSLHARVLAQHQDTELVMIVDPDRARGEAAAELWDSTWAADIDSFESFDAVVVATPTQFHVPWALRSIASGRPTLVEKPLAPTLAETVELLDAAEAADVPIMCGLLERYNPAVKAMFEIIEAPLHLSVVRHSPHTPRISTGVASDLSIHDIDLAVRVAGMAPVGVSAQISACHPDSPVGSEDIAEISLRFESGLLASLSASRVSQRKIRTLQVAELSRLIEVDLLRRDLTVYHHVGADFLPGRDTGYRQQTVIDIPVISDSREPLASQLDQFVGLVRGELDKDEERASILPPHTVLDQVMKSAAVGS